MKTKEMIFLFLSFPMILGTTYVMKDNGAEVGRMTEHDGKNKIQVVEATVARPVARAQVQPVKVVKPPVPLAIQPLVTSADSQLEMEKRQALDWGIRQGMTRAEVEKIQRSSHGTGYDEYAPDDSRNTSYWVWEYNWETEHFKHKKKVYFGTNYAGKEAVVKEANFSERKYY